MEQLTVIIPTIQKNIEVLQELLAILDADDVVHEIILIDNSLQGFNNIYSKLKVITPKKNLFVNPSWNLGVKESKTQYFALFNDDLLVCRNFCTKVMNLIVKKTDIGILGMDVNSVINTLDMSLPEETDFQLVKEDKNQLRPNNWGTIIFGKKELYNTIPRCLKIMCGDDYLRYMVWENNLSVYDLMGANVKHLGSISCSSKEFIKIGQREIIRYAKIDKNYKKTSSYIWAKREQSVIRKFLQFIFSLKNTSDKRHKVITLLGFKFKIRRGINQ